MSLIFLREEVEDSNVYIVESSEGNGEKKFFIEGNFIQTNTLNKNKRVYPRPIMESALQNYQSIITANRALGELGHPDTPTTNLDKVSHIMESMMFDGDIVKGKARVLDTPMGKIAKVFISEGVKLGVSTRGVGKTKNNIVQSGYRLVANDIVADPSGPDCFVNGLMEGNTEWVFDENGYLVEQTKKEIDNLYSKNLSKGDKEKRVLEIFNSFLLKV